MRTHSEFKGWNSHKLLRPSLFSELGKTARGFTLIELVVVISIIGVLAVAAIPRLFSRVTFEAHGFYDNVLSINRYAQKIAIAQHRNVTVNVNTGSGTISACFNPGCAPIPNPATQAAYSLTTPSGVTLTTTAASFTFDAAGRPVPDSAVTIGVIGDGMTRNITIERETGYVH